MRRRISIIFIAVLSVYKSAIRGWITQDVEVILILEDRLHSFGNSDVNHGVSDHASIAACTGCAERVCVINIEVIVFALQNEPCLMVW